MIDIHSSTWQFLLKTLSEDLEKLRKKLESTVLTENETFLLRGEIRRIRMILNLPDQLNKTATH
jgi:hypothetical protein